MDDLDEKLEQKRDKYKGDMSFQAGFAAAEAILRPELRDRDKDLVNRDKDLAKVKDDAELAEFLLFIREDVATFESNYCFSFPSKDEYVAKIGVLRPILPSQINEDVHFRRWLWILVAGDENQCHAIKYLRDALNNDVENYLWFSKQMEVFYSVLSGDIRGKSPLYVRHMKREKFPEYIKFFNGDLRSAIEHFVQSRDKI